MTTNTQASRSTNGRRRTISSIVGGLPLVAAAGLLPLVLPAPAYAVDNVICVGNPAGTCGQTAASIQAAILVANANAVDDTILLGPGTYDDGPYGLNGTAHALTLKGSGQGATFLTMPPAPSSDEYINATHATVRDLTIKMTAGSSDNDAGLVMWTGSAATSVRIDGAGTYNAQGIEAENSTISKTAVEMPLGTYSQGIFATGGNTVTDSTISGDQGFDHSAANTTDTLSRVRIVASSRGISTDSGTVSVDDTVIDLGTSGGTGLAAMNFNASAAPMAIHANHVTIVGSGKDSEGAFAYAANPNVLQMSSIQLHNSIIQGPETSLAVMAGNNGLQGGPSIAAITTRYSSWTSKSAIVVGQGSAVVVNGPGNLNVDPAFVDATAGNFRLKPGSPLVDHGDPEAAGPALDLDGKTRVLDSDGNGTAVRDMGAYEQKDTRAPATKFTLKPAKLVTKRTVKFKFASNEPGVTYTCKLDKRVWRSCASPKKMQVKVGKHIFKVRAKDAAGNVDATPATYRFKRVRTSS